jgi:hypothetical protein
MKLTDNEKREILKLIEADKSLPDKYRFLLFDDKREVELVWNGKTSEVTNIVLPFQVIEQVDEPRKSKPLMDANTRESGKGTRGHSRSFPVKNNPYQLPLFDFRGRQKSGWTNKLIWGDNKLILSSLKNGPIRNEIEKAGGIKLVYIDPPFDVGADFSMDIEIGDPSTGSGQAETFTKKPGVLEELAYRDTWGKGADSFIAMILKAYKAETVDNFRCFHGKKAGRIVAVGPVNLPVTRLFVEEIILECREKRVSRVDILAFEFEMGLFPNIQEEAKSKGIDLALKYIPREVFDKRAVEKNQIVFHDVSYIEVKPHVKHPPVSPRLRGDGGGGGCS